MSICNSPCYKGQGEEERGSTCIVTYTPRHPSTPPFRHPGVADKAAALEPCVATPNHSQPRLF